MSPPICFALVDKQPLGVRGQFDAWFVKLAASSLVSSPCSHAATWRALEGLAIPILANVAQRGQFVVPDGDLLR